MTSEIRRAITRTENTRDDWRTPKAVTDGWRVFCAGRSLTTHDPFPSPDKAHHFAAFNARWNGHPWTCDDALFCNPPYGRDLWQHAALINPWYSQAGLVVSLVPARPGSRWWRLLATPGRVVIVPDERMHFDDGKDPAMFPSALIVGGAPDLAEIYARQWCHSAWITKPITDVDLWGGR